MALFLAIVVAIAIVLGPSLLNAFLRNPAFNGIIFGLLIAGIAYIFRQVIQLEPASAWIDDFRERLANRDLTAPPGPAPRMLAPMARMLSSRQSGRVTLSPASLQTLLDGIAARLDETRETSRYLIGTLVFLGLLGTFYGLLETVSSVGNVIGALNVGASDIARAFADLKSGLEAPLHGMSTAFSTSLFGLAGSLVLGFLDLQAGQAQNRFYNDLEEWLSTYTRLSAGPYGEGGDASMPAYLHALLEQTADSMENLQRIIARSEEGRIAAHNTLVGLSDRLSVLGEHMKAGQMLMLRLAESQIELQPSLTRLTSRRREFARPGRRSAYPSAQYRGLCRPPDRGRRRGAGAERAGIARRNSPARAHDRGAGRGGSRRSARRGRSAPAIAARNRRALGKPPLAALEHRHLAGLRRCPGAAVDGHHLYSAGVHRRAVFPVRRAVRARQGVAGAAAADQRVERPAGAGTQRQRAAAGDRRDALGAAQGQHRRARHR